MKSSKQVVVTSGTIFDELDLVFLTKLGIELIHILQIKPLPNDLINYLLDKDKILLVEESLKSGGCMKGWWLNFQRKISRRGKNYCHIGRVYRAWICGMN